jgi:hypothetical protein
MKGMREHVEVGCQCLEIIALAHDMCGVADYMIIMIPSRYAEFESRFARGRTNRVRAR